MDTLKLVARLLTKNNKNLSIAESCSGGFLSSLLTNIPGSSKFYHLGIIAYSNKSKTQLLNIPKTLLKNKGSVSRKVAILMSQNIRKLTKTSFGLSTTGIAGPSGATKTKPKGLVYIALSSNKETICEKFIFKGNRLSVKKQAASACLNLLKENLSLK